MRIAVHVIGALDFLERRDAPRTRFIETAQPPKTLARVRPDTGHGL